MTRIRNLAVHPFRNGLLALLIGVVSFFAANAWMQTGAAWASVFWALIPLLGILTFLSLTGLGLVRKVRS